MQSISREDYEALPDAAKAFFVADGDKFVLAEFSQLRKSLDTKDEKLTEKDRAIADLTAKVAEITKKFDGIKDPKAALDALEKIEDLGKKEMIDKGDYEAALEAERAKHGRQLKKLQDDFDSERNVTSGLLIDSQLPRLLTLGKKPDGMGEGEIPVIRKGLVEAVESHFHRKYNPEVIVASDGERKAVVTVNGVSRDMVDFVVNDWLPGDEAAEYTEAAENTGGHKGLSRPSLGGGQGNRTVVPRDQAGANLEQLAAGTHTLAPED